MIWGYHCFWKHPYGSYGIVFFWGGRECWELIFGLVLLLAFSHPFFRTKKKVFFVGVIQEFLKTSSLVVFFWGGVGPLRTTKMETCITNHSNQTPTQHWRCPTCPSCLSLNLVGKHPEVFDFSFFIYLLWRIQRKDVFISIAELFFDWIR